MRLLQSASSLLLPLSLATVSFAARFQVEIIPSPSTYRLGILNLPNFGPSVAKEYPINPFSTLAPYAVIYDQGKVLAAPPPPSGYQSYDFLSSNDRGEFVGYATRKVYDGFVYDGVSYKGGQWTIMAAPPPFDEELAIFGVNDSGDTTGVLGGDAFVSIGGKTTLLGTPPGDPGAVGVGPVAINNVRQIAGNSGDDPYSDHMTPFLYQNGSYRKLAELPGALNTQAIALNQTGVVLVNYTDDPADIGVVEGHAALLADGSFKDLGQVPGGLYLQAAALDDFGDVTGFVYFGDVAHAWLYSDGAIEDLNTLVDEPGYLLTTATAINDLGHIVVTLYRKSDYQQFTAILTPICPSSLGSAGPEPASAAELKQNARWCSVRH